MAAETFTEAEWARIFALMETRGEAFGLPARRDDSVVLGSWNIRKLGPDRRGAETWRFLAQTVDRFDLLAVQEVMDDIGGLQRLRRDLGGYGVLCSDITGQTPGASTGMPERLAFLYREATVERTEVASDISVDKADVVETLIEHHHDFLRAFFGAGEQYAEDKARYEMYRRYLDAREQHAGHVRQIEAFNAAAEKAGLDLPALPLPPEPVPVPAARPPRVESVHLPRFVTFIRQPQCASFRVRGAGRDDAYEFLAVNAHLLYGSDPNERKWEFDALMNWLVNRACSPERMMYRDILLFGDLNLSRAETATGRVQLFDEIKALNGRLQERVSGARANFPLLDGHPRPPIYAGDRARLDAANEAERRARGLADGAHAAWSAHLEGKPNKGRTKASRANYAAWVEELARLDGARRQANDAWRRTRKAAAELRPVLRTNAPRTQTYDHIGIIGFDARFPDYWQNADAGMTPGGYDYGVFDFVGLFAEAVLGQPWSDLRSRQRRDFVDRFEHEVSDHVPVWIRLPLPDGPPTWRADGAG